MRADRQGEGVLRARGPRHRPREEGGPRGESGSERHVRDHSRRTRGSDGGALAGPHSPRGRSFGVSWAVPTRESVSRVGDLSRRESDEAYEFGRTRRTKRGEMTLRDKGTHGVCCPGALARGRGAGGVRHRRRRAARVWGASAERQGGVGRARPHLRRTRGDGAPEPEARRVLVRAGTERLL